MKKFGIGKRLWDVRNCTEVEILKFNGVAYYCEIITEGEDDDEKGSLEYQWLSWYELNNLKPIG